MMKNHCNRHLMIQPRICSRWSDFNMLKLNYSIDDSIHNLMLWYQSGKLNWIEFYCWLQTNRLDWKKIFVSKKLGPCDVGCYLEFTDVNPQYSGFETYNNVSGVDIAMIMQITDQYHKESNEIANASN